MFGLEESIGLTVPYGRSEKAYYSYVLAKNHIKDVFGLTYDARNLVESSYDSLLDNIPDSETEMLNMPNIGVPKRTVWSEEKDKPRSTDKLDFTIPDLPLYPFESKLD